MAQGSAGDPKIYTEALCAELGELAKMYSDRVFTSFFIGGGTPSVLPVDLMERVLKATLAFSKRSADFEFTVECNPGTVDSSKLSLYRRYGVNRLSFGLQSANDDELKRLGRIHDYAQFLESYGLARSCGFENINIDLISAIPGQSIEDWEKSLRTVAMLNPEHISAYSLIIEPGTVFGDIFSEKESIGFKQINRVNQVEPERCGFDEFAVKYPLPDEDTEREMYGMTRNILREYGFERYEISNYSRPGFESSHNLGYWTGEEYIGAGLGAASYVCADGQAPGTMLRYKNTDDMKTYLCEHLERKSTEESGDTAISVKLRHEEEYLDSEGLMAEFMILHLRLIKGLELNEFRSKFGIEVTERYGTVIDKFVDGGFLKLENGRLMLTERGLDVSNTVMAEFM